MSTLKFDFRHYYQRGERRESDPIAYQYDLGHILAVYVPVSATYELHYSFPDYTESADYVAESIGAADDGGGGYKLTAHVPNVLFEREGELRVHIVGSADNHIITTYEGYITIRQRVKPDDYVDDDPDNGAISYVEAAKNYSLDSEAFARGTRDNTAVESTDPAYQNNSKYFKELAETAKNAAQTAATNAGTSETNAAASAAAAAAIVTVANDGMVLIDKDDSDKEYVVTFRVEGHHVISTLTEAEST